MTVAPPSSRQRVKHAVTLPELDETQQQLVARLDSTREYWHTGLEPYDPRRSHGSIQSRYAAGRELRKQVPRERHAEWSPPKARPSGADFVIAGNEGRQADLVPLRMGRMAASPFAFLRGAAAAMACDLSHTPTPGIQTVIDGDGHINNFGLYGTAQRDIVVDLNDFDEAVFAPWEWDLKRLVASVNVAARENGFTRRERRRAVVDCVSGYQSKIQQLHPLPILDVWSIYGYADRLPPGLKVPKKAWVMIQKTVEKARGTTNLTLLPKVASRQRDGGWRFNEDPPILTRVGDETRAKIVDSLKDYSETVIPGYRNMLRRYSVADVAHRVVGVGSVGTRAYLVLLFGNTDGDPLFLQVKESAEPAHARYLPPLAMKELHHGRRVVMAQRALQATGDPLLGYTGIEGREYFVRQMKNMKASMPMEWLTGDPFFFWCFICGALMARAHCRNADASRIAGYIGKSAVLGEALAEFAEAYGDQTERDHASLVDAIKKGRVKAVMGV